MAEGRDGAPPLSRTACPNSHCLLYTKLRHVHVVYVYVHLRVQATCVPIPAADGPGWMMADRSCMHRSGCRYDKLLLGPACVCVFWLVGWVFEVLGCKLKASLFRCLQSGMYMYYMDRVVHQQQNTVP